MGLTKQRNRNSPTRRTIWILRLLSAAFMACQAVAAVAAASELLKPCDARLMRCFPVSTRINHFANDDEECSEPMELAQIQDRLFS